MRQCGAGRSRTICGAERYAPFIAVMHDMIERYVDRQLRISGGNDQCISRRDYPHGSR